MTIWSATALVLFLGALVGAFLKYVSHSAKKNERLKLEAENSTRLATDRQITIEEWNKLQEEAKKRERELSNVDPATRLERSIVRPRGVPDDTRRP